VPPFPFNTPAVISQDIVVMLNGDGQSISLWSSVTQRELIKIVKKGDYKIKTCAAYQGYIAYSDAQDT
jgi:hypothetical protein